MNYNSLLSFITKIVFREGWGMGGKALFKTSPKTGDKLLKWSVWSVAIVNFLGALHIGTNRVFAYVTSQCQ